MMGGFLQYRCSFYELNAPSPFLFNSGEPIPEIRYSNCEYRFMKDWADLPEDILSSIYQYLSLKDRLRAAATCKSWFRVLKNANSWKTTEFKFYTQKDVRSVHVIGRYGNLFRNFLLEFDQFKHFNRKAANDTIDSLSSLKERKITKIAIFCSGNNPLFYGGRDFIEKLIQLFNSYGNDVSSVPLTHLDLGKVSFPFKDDFLDSISNNLVYLQDLNIENMPIICEMTEDAMLRLVQNCRRLKRLQTLKFVFSEKVLSAFCEPSREPLQHLYLKCRREEKYANDPEHGKEQLSSSIWARVRKTLPQLRVTLDFDPTCPTNMMSVVMKPEVPCQELRLETRTHLHEEILRACTYYNETLEKVILQTFPTEELNADILELSSKCLKLRALHVFCLLNENTIDQVLRDHPNMKSQLTYTLRSTVGVGPWATDEILNK